MFVIKGNAKTELFENELKRMLKNFEKVVLDLGTGDGRFIFKNALVNPKIFYIGIEPSKTQIEIYSKKAQRNKLKNTVFVLGSLEFPPQEIYGLADIVVINFPWGTLLKETVHPSRDTLQTLNLFLKKQGEIIIHLGYHKEFEPSETERLELPEINRAYLEQKLIPAYRAGGFSLVELTELSKNDLKEIETTWSKKLAFGSDRAIFRLKFQK